MVADLEKRANAGDVRAECLLGRAYSVGDGLPAHRADIPRAVTWLNKAAGQGDVEAVYLLGSLMAGGQALVRGPSGVVGPDPQRGRQMMNEALQRGYNPATGAVTPPETARASSGDGGDGALAVGALLLGLVVLAASASGGQGSSADANGSDVIDDMEAERRDRWSKRACMIPTTMTMMNPDGTETEVPDSREGFGFECPEY